MNASTTRSAPKRAHYLGLHTDESPLTATLVLERRSAAPHAAGLGAAAPAAREDFGTKFGAHPADIAHVREFLQAHNLTEIEYHGHRRTLRIYGAPDDMRKAFGVELHRYQPHDGSTAFTAADVAPRRPDGVLGVLGLDRRPVARPYFQVKPRSVGDDSDDGSFTPVQLGDLYKFPPSENGHGQCIGIVELGGGYTDENLQQYFKELGITAPSVVAIPVAGGANTTGTDADGEVQLDIEVCGALAPGAALAVYFTTNTDEGFHEAISQAAHDTVHKPSIISISWGGPEDDYGDQAMQAIQSALEDAAGLGITVTVAAGDNGAADGERSGLHADFPSSSPSVLSCGGTKLIASGESITLESVWNENATGNGATGGGVSQFWPKPAWQGKVTVPVAPNGFVGRGVPDVAGVADPITGYKVRVNGEDQVVGGTSAVAPLWAALIARINQSLGHSVGSLFSTVYTLPVSAFRDITEGNNAGYKAGAGWDPCTGLGTPVGTALLTALEAIKKS